MDQKSDLIREDIDETRTALTAKLETLEGQIRDKVEMARNSVEGTIENVKSTVRKFTPRHQIEEHPFVALGGVVAGGFLVGRALNAPRQDVRKTSPYRTEKLISPPFSPTAPSEREKKSTLLSQLGETFGDEIQLVKGMALGAIFKGIKDLAKRSFPQIEDNIELVINSAMKKFDIPEVTHSDSPRQDRTFSAPSNRDNPASRVS